MDDHFLWYLSEVQKVKVRAQSWGRTDCKTSEEMDRSGQGEGINPEQLSPQVLAELWKKISERAQVDIETASKKWRDQKGGLHQGLNALNREKFNYATFLKRFSMLGEAMQINDKEFENLKGLIYFKDGYGTFPKIKPNYDTVFVFLDEDYVENPEVPFWAIKLVLSTDDIMEEHYK